jgi:hypothetical protein
MTDELERIRKELIIGICLGGLGKIRRNLSIAGDPARFEPCTSRIQV